MQWKALATGWLLSCSTALFGQAIATGGMRGGDAALTYQYIHSNTQPGKCGCFSITGVDLSATRIIITDHTAGVLDISAATAKNGPGTGNSLTLVSYMLGGRYYLQPFHHTEPFAQAMVGIAHAGGGIAGAGDNTYALAGRLGGGIDVPFSDRLSLRLLQVDYYLTEFPNASTGRQNNYLIAAGVALRFARAF